MIPLDTAVVGLRIGSLDGEVDAFAPIWALDISPAGDRVVVLENQTKTVRIFDREGELVAVVGGEGGGPGEFGNPVGLGVMGDTVWVADFFTYRYSFFSLDGEYLGDFRPQVLARQNRDHYPPRPSQLLEDGTLLGGPSLPSEAVAEGRVTRVPVLRLTRDGDIIDTLAWRSLSNHTLMVRAPNPEDRWGESYSRQPFADEWPILFSGADSSIIRVEPHPESRAPELVSYSFDGFERFRTAVGWPPVPLSEQRVEEVVERELERLTKSPSFPNVSRSDLRSWLVDALYVPESLSPVAGMKRAKDGTIWVQKRPDTEGGASLWRAFSPSGDVLRDVVIPAGITVRSIVGDVFWCTETDDLDVPYVVRLRAAP